MEQYINIKTILSSICFCLVGLVMLGLGYYLFDKLTPGHFWKEILEEHNTALAVLVGAVVLGLSIIIASAIRG